MGAPLGVPVKVFPGKVVLVMHSPTGWSPRANRKERAEQQHSPRQVPDADGWLSPWSQVTSCCSEASDHFISCRPWQLPGGGDGQEGEDKVNVLSEG